MFLDRGTLRVLTLTYVYLPNNARAYLVPQSDKNPYSCSGPISADPICPQPIGADSGNLMALRVLIEMRVPH